MQMLLRFLLRDIARVVFAIRTAAITVHSYSCILIDTYFTNSLNKLSFLILSSTRLTLHNSGFF